MKTVKEFLAEADRAKLLDSLFYQILSDPIFLLECKDRTLQDIRERYCRHMSEFVDRLLAINPEPSKDRVLYLYSEYEKGERLEMISLPEITENIEATGYDFGFTDWNISLGYLVADTKLTQDNITTLLTQYLEAVSFFGTESSQREAKISELEKSLLKASDPSEMEKAIPADEAFAQIRKKFGFPVPEKDTVQEEYRSRVHDALYRYAQYSRIRERKRILDTFRQNEDNERSTTE